MRTTVSRRPEVDFAAVCEENLDGVFGYLLYLTGNRTVAEDLAAETFERALRRLRRFDPRRGTARTWLLTLARSTALDHFRSEQRRRKREGTYALLDSQVDEGDVFGHGFSPRARGGAPEPVRGRARGGRAARAPRSRRGDGRPPARDQPDGVLDNATAPSITRAPEANERVGSLVLAVGRPRAQSVCRLWYHQRRADNWRGAAGGRIDRVLRLDLSIYDGFSGGPLVDPSGAVIGIDNSALARGTAVALPAETVDRVVDELLERGHVRRPFIGVAVQQVALNAATVDRHKLPHDGALVVVSVADGSPAERAGILIGDVLLSAGGQRCVVRRICSTRCRVSPTAKTLELERLRRRRDRQVVVTPIDRARGEHQ